MAIGDLLGLDLFCGHALGSLRQIFIIRASDVVRVPRVCDDLLVTDPIQIKPGKAFTPYHPEPDSGRFNEEAVDGEQGPAMQYTVSYRHRCLRPEADLEFRKLNGAEVIVMTRDHQGHVRLIGTPDYPLRFRHTGTTADSRSGRNTYEVTISGRTPRDLPALYLTPNIDPPNELQVPLAQLNLTRTACTYNIDAAGSQGRDGSPITAATGTALLRYDFFTPAGLMYSGQIQANADATVLANWTITPVQRTASNFETEIVDAIATGTGFSWTWNGTALATALDPPQELNWGDPDPGSPTGLFIALTVTVGSASSVPTAVPPSSRITSVCNVKPYAVNLGLSSTGSISMPQAGDIMTAEVGYADVDGDAEGSSAITWHMYDDPDLLTNEVQVGAGSTLNVPTEGKYYTYKYQPIAATGVLQGNIYKFLPDIISLTPTVSLSADNVSVEEGDTVAFIATIDNFSAAVTYTFDPGDGTTPTTQSSPNFSHTYANPGTWLAKVTATDGTVTASSPPLSIVVEDVVGPAPPTAANANFGVEPQVTTAESGPVVMTPQASYSSGAGVSEGASTWEAYLYDDAAGTQGKTLASSGVKGDTFSLDAATVGATTTAKWIQLEWIPVDANGVQGALVRSVVYPLLLDNFIEFTTAATAFDVVTGPSSYLQIDFGDGAGFEVFDASSNPTTINKTGLSSNPKTVRIRGRAGANPLLKVVDAGINDVAWSDDFFLNPGNEMNLSGNQIDVQAALADLLPLIPTGLAGFVDLALYGNTMPASPYPDGMMKDAVDLYNLTVRVRADWYQLSTGGL